MAEPLVLPRNCGNCAWWDGDCHCAIPPTRGARLIAVITAPAMVVCGKHELDTEAAHNDAVEGAAV